MPRVGASVIFGAAGVSVAGAPVVGFLLSTKRKSLVSMNCFLEHDIPSTIKLLQN
jgi:hypothetical protein